MHVPPNLLRVLRCPTCGAALGRDDSRVVCMSPPHHELETEDDMLVFARPDAGKYDTAYASRYAALWAFGYATLHSGLDEGLYRTVSSFVAEALVVGPEEPVIIDAGCGVGRVTADCARLAPRGHVLAIDASLAMLAFARQVVRGREPLDVELPGYGYSRLTIPPLALDGPVFARADAEHLPIADDSADMVLSVNIIDRLPHGPELAFAEAHRVLKRRAAFVFTDPLNWIEPWLWERYPDGESILRLLRETGFALETSFDRLIYREILDGRGSTEEFRTVAVKAVKE